MSVEMLLHRTYCHVLLVAFSGGKCRACLALPDVQASDLSVLIHSRWLLPDPPRHPPPPGVSLFWRFRCYLDRPPALHGPLRHPSLPGVSLFRRFRCYPDLPPIPHGSLRHPPPPGVSRFRHFRCYLDRPPAPRGSLRHPPPPGVTQASRPGTMAAGAREQAASCDAFVLSRRLPAPDAPPSRTSPLCLVAKSFPEPSPTLAEPRPGPWPGLPLRIPSGSVKDTPSRQRSDRGRHDRRGLAGRVGHAHPALRALPGLPS